MNRHLTKSKTTRGRVAAATQQAQVFLLPAHQTHYDRAEALLTAAELVRQAIEYAVRGGRDDIGMTLLGLAQDIEGGPKP